MCDVLTEYSKGFLGGQVWLSGEVTRRLGGLLPLVDAEVKVLLCVLAAEVSRLKLVEPRCDVCG